MTASFARALGAGERAGAILFKRNLTGDPRQAAELNATLRDTAPSDLPPMIAVDQEGGRVARLGPPALVLPPMAQLAAASNEDFLRRVARAQAMELAAIGFTMNLAPVLDVNTRPDNPVIGDRAFGTDPEGVARLAVAYAQGLESGGVLACGKHFPGHGDTTADSHLELPVVAHSLGRLESVELVPFRAAARARIAALMTAHVLCPSLDPNVPATLSRAVCTDLRTSVDFQGILVSDDLEMKAISDRWGAGEAAVRAVDAGCDLLLVCESEVEQARAHDALVKRAAHDEAFRARCIEAARRVLEARRRVPPRKTLDPAAVGGAESRAVAFDLAERMRKAGA
jgi:beta-N-acetylhexosaminidase